MNRILIIFLLIGFYSCGEKRKSEKKPDNVGIGKSVSELKDFELLQDFEKNKAEFGTPDTFELNEDLIEGGELKVYHDKDFDYVVMDFWLYGETGKLNYTYWTEKDGKMKFKFVKQVKYKYDKPFNQKNIKIDTTIYYLSYSELKKKLFDINQTEIRKEKLIDSINTEVESFFKEVTKGIEIVK